MIIHQLKIYASVERHEDGTYSATIPEVDDLEAEGDTAKEAVERLSESAILRLRTW